MGTSKVFISGNVQFKRYSRSIRCIQKIEVHFVKFSQTEYQLNLMKIKPVVELKGRRALSIVVALSSPEHKLRSHDEDISYDKGGC